MKTIAVDEETWKRLRKLRDKFGAKSYDEVIDKLIELWHKQELTEGVEELLYPDEKSNRFLNYVFNKKLMKQDKQD
ncbi:MAG: hypothetical protein QXO15_07760 [Nitrososphaerota archaeon]